jgi:uncharacterized protein (DUF2345 family)
MVARERQRKSCHAGAEALDYAPHDERADRAAQSAHERCDRKRRQRAQQHAPATVLVAQPAGWAVATALRSESR